MSITHHYTIFETAKGFCAMAWGENGIAGFRLPGETAQETRNAMLRRLPSAVEAEPSVRIGQVIERVRTYFAGDAADFSDLALDLSGQTDLYRRIYDATRRLGWGKATTYGTLAGELDLGAAGAWPVVTWLRALRASGVQNRVRIGMAGPASIPALMKFAKRCGVRASANGFARHAASIGRLLTRATPAEAVNDLAEAAAAENLGQIASHFYSFGGLVQASKWVRDAKNGVIA